MADEFVVDDSVFKSVDITKIAAFINKAPGLVDEFEKIKEDFNNVNSELLAIWVGEGADEYKQETDHILEKIGDLKTTIEAINSTTLADIRKQFSDADNELGKFNRQQASDGE